MKTVEFAYKLTPRAERILAAASDEASKRGHGYVGTEHIFWALMADPRSLPAMVLEKAGVRTSAVQEIERLIATSKPSNLVADRDGNIIGRMVSGPDGTPRVVDDDGNEIEPHN